MVPLVTCLFQLCQNLQHFLLPCCVGYVLIFFHTGKRKLRYWSEQKVTVHIFWFLYFHILYCYNTTFPCSPCHKRGISSYCSMSFSEVHVLCLLCHSCYHLAVIFKYAAKNIPLQFLRHDDFLAINLLSPEFYI
jgi:hypothetical protein